MPAGAIISNSLTIPHTGGEYGKQDIDSVFHRLLEVPKESEEFHRLWQRLDAYLSREIARQKVG